ncbi:MAG: 30S ribosomal protein S8 [bacterium]|nr:30S ribosomal protein S8 [bacterium]
MSMTDPIADMLTRIRNANHVRHEKVDIPASRLKVDIARILKQRKFIKGYKLIEDRKQGILRVYLRYGPNREHILSVLKRVSRPGLRRYVRTDEIPTVCGGLGTAIFSTSRGLKTDRDCKREGIGGEFLCYVW